MDPTPEDLLFIIQLQLEDAQALIEAGEAADQEAARVLMADLNDLQGVLSEHTRLAEGAREARPARHIAIIPAIQGQGQGQPPDGPLDGTGAGERVVQALDNLAINEGQDTCPEEQELKANNDNQETNNAVNLLQCHACTNSSPEEKTLTLPCEHVYCHDCVSQLHEQATRDQSLYPPRCCRQEIPFYQVRPILSEELTKAYEKKSAEYSTPNPVYCSRPHCSAFLPPDESGRDSSAAHCDECQTMTCRSSKKTAHDGQCSKDETPSELRRLAEAQGWKSCGGCRRMVELTFGCNHISESPSSSSQVAG